MKTLGAKIKEARLQKGLTQKQLALQLSIKNTTLNNWEQDRNKPDINYIEMLCRLLNVPPGYFFEIHRGVNDVSSEENELIAKYRLLSDYGKKAVEDMMESLVEYEKRISHADNNADRFPTSYMITPIKNDGT
ncbi:MAG: helix-turn-helix domain-containing protein [Oscillospiraceae bacterium]|jgi:transcriptional regulator with XRE-family HTH domain|nr:helix-turn-helix domain-containing protein [Oscillospiraceae bacterium]MCI1991248.1 helix-turn-helix domain-containing protein [Oscillospiraceae bacterium]MCI2036130.1 helix-turn-helix domain-containing protein [Oscillospiraceae bacterium]